LKSEDFNLVFSNAEKFAEKFFLFLVSKNKDNYSRLGLIVAKKNVKLATKRNKIKRIVRESFRNQQELKNLNIIFIAKKEIDNLNSKELRDQLDKQWEKIHNYYQ
jgi:ribonuclease P protein component